MSELFREIDEDLRRDRIAAWWGRWNRPIMAVLVVVVLAGGGYAWWQRHLAAANAADSQKFVEATALARAGKPADAQAALDALGRQGPSGYGLLARFQAAMLKVTTDKAGAAADFRAIAEDSAVDPTYRDLATLSAAYQSVDAKPADAEQQLQPLTASGNPWRYSARELTAFARLKTGDRKGAADMFKALSDALEAPGAIRARATEMAAALGQG